MPGDNQINKLSDNKLPAPKDEPALHVATVSFAGTHTGRPEIDFAHNDWAKLPRKTCGLAEGAPVAVEGRRVGVPGLEPAGRKESQSTDVEMYKASGLPCRTATQYTIGVTLNGENYLNNRTKG